MTQGEGKPAEANDAISADLFRDRHPSPAEQDWAETTLAAALRTHPEQPIGAPGGSNRDEFGQARFTSVSGVPVRRLYTQADLPQDWEATHLGLPGQPPYTRGIHSTGYRGKLWTMRQFSGFATPEETNARYRYLLANGGGGLSVAFDLPTLMGYDSDAAESEGEVGKCGVAIDSLEDMETLFSGIDLEKTSVSMTINSPANVLWAMYLVTVEKQGGDWKKVAGTLQNDILKEYIAQKEYIFPPAPSMRLVVDTLEFGSLFTPRFNPISISGYHIREAGSTALQELAFTLYDGVEYVEWGLRRGLQVDDFAPRLSFFFNAHNDFFEEIGKFRAARKVWYRLMTERFGAQDPRSQLDAVSHPDGGRLADRAATQEQYRAGGHPGPGRSAGRHTKPAYRRLRRGTRLTDGRCGPHCLAHPADPGLRIRGGQYRRPAGRVLFCGTADPGYGKRRFRLLPKTGCDGGHGAGH